MHLIKINGSSYLNIEGLREVILRPSESSDNRADVWAVYADGSRHWLRSFTTKKDNYKAAQPAFAEYVKNLNQGAGGCT